MLTDTPVYHHQKNWVSFKTGCVFQETRRYWNSDKWIVWKRKQTPSAIQYHTDFLEFNWKWNRKILSEKQRKDIIKVVERFLFGNWFLYDHISKNKPVYQWTIIYRKMKLYVHKIKNIFYFYLVFFYWIEYWFIFLQKNILNTASCCKKRNDLSISNSRFDSHYGGTYIVSMLIR